MEKKRLLTRDDLVLAILGILFGIAVILMLEYGV